MKVDIRAFLGEWFEELTEDNKTGSLDYEQDNQGQLIFYSGIFEHSDGSFHDEPEEEEPG